MYNDGVKLIEARGEGDSPHISLWFDKQLRDVFISLLSLSFCKQLRQVISLLICLSFGKQQIQNNRLLNCSYLLTVLQGVKSK
ncbi:hypothetical protein B7695_00020 [Streptococcus mitis]|uniref:Uncharacterized protein n=1 Tax=Streptococcus mitis TaxID=28037 RepID=A0A1X1L156_STRMT|nr:hypothetical protein B7695_00020 [Streptococcus mitis]